MNKIHVFYLISLSTLLEETSPLVVDQSFPAIIQNIMTLSIVIPIFNEKKTLATLLQSVEGSPLSLKKEIILVDDFSTDGTRDDLKKLELSGKYKIVYLPQNYGKGKALQEGFKIATGDFVITQDADLEYNPKEYQIMVDPLMRKEADVVYGSRFQKKGPLGEMTTSHYFGNQFLTRTSNLFTGFSITDMETGYKAFTKEALSKITPSLVSFRFGIEPEITARVAHEKLRLVEIPISYKARTKEEGKKIRWRDGFPALWAIIRFNLFG